MVSVPVVANHCWYSIGSHGKLGIHQSPFNPKALINPLEVLIDPWGVNIGQFGDACSASNNSL